MTVVVQLPPELGVRSPHRFAMGGMAELFRGEKVLPEGGTLRVVVKHMLPQYNDDDVLVKRFRDEARVGLGLRHAHIVRVLEYREIDRHHFMVMEEIEGLDLAAIIARSRALDGGIPEPVAAYFFAGIASALSYMAEATTSDGQNLNLVHRDISPSNVLVTRRGLAKLIDFGVARTDFREARTETGHLVGKHAYMSPEQILGEPIDIRSDLFALGAVAFELFCGRRAFQGASQFETFNNVLNVDPPRIDELRPGTDPSIVGAIERCLHKEVDDRFAHPRELAAQLQAYLGKVVDPPAEVTVERFLERVGQVEPGAAPAADDIETLPHDTPPPPAALHQLAKPAATVAGDSSGGARGSSEGASQPGAPDRTEPGSAPGTRTAAPARVVAPTPAAGATGDADAPPAATEARPHAWASTVIVLTVGFALIAALLFVIDLPRRMTGSRGGELTPSGEAAHAGNGGATSRDAGGGTLDGTPAPGDGQPAAIVVEDVPADGSDAAGGGGGAAPPAGDPDTLVRGASLPGQVIRLPAERRDADGEGGGNPRDPGAPLATGTIAIFSTLDVRVLVNGDFVGATPIRRLELETGRHVFEYYDLQTGWYRKQEVAISSGANRDIRLSPEPMP